jgi:HPt (histidine-containing phosphotransfer) domain-containing protein
VPEHQNVPRDQDVFDRSVLDDLAEDVGDVATVAAVADIYLEQLPERLGHLRATLTSDPASCQQVAHALKSASATLGLMRLADCCRRLELAIGTDAGDAEPLLTSVEAAAAPASAHLTAWREGL